MSITTHLRSRKGRGKTRKLPEKKVDGDGDGEGDGDGDQSCVFFGGLYDRHHNDDDDDDGDDDSDLT